MRCSVIVWVVLLPLCDGSGCVAHSATRAFFFIAAARYSKRLGVCQRRVKLGVSPYIEAKLVKLRVLDLQFQAFPQREALRHDL